MFAILLGTKHKGDLNKEMLAFDIDNYNQEEMEVKLKAGYNPTHITYSIDIDTSRVLTITPIIKLTKEENKMTLNRTIQHSKTKDEYIYVDRQIEIIANGTGEMGELNDIYVDMVIKVLDKHFKSLKLPLLSAIIVVDDKRK